MSKKIMALTLTTVSAAILALPATSSALVPLHLNPTPEGTQTIDDVGANPVLSMTSGNTFECDSVHGSATFNEGGTDGTLSLSYTNCRLPFGKCNVATTALPFHFLTLPEEKLGVLVTTSSGHFASFPCLFPFLPEVKGTGVIGTIVSSECGQVSTELTIDFNAVAHGVQEHIEVAETETEYTLKNGSTTLAQDMTWRLTLSNETELECT